MTEDDWKELDQRCLREQTPEMHRDFPRDEEHVHLKTLRVLAVGNPRSEKVLWCPHSHISVADALEAEGKFALLVRMRGIEAQDRQRANQDKKAMKLWNGKPLVIHYLSDNEEDRSTQEPYEIRVCCSELTYRTDTQKYCLTAPNHVRAGLVARVRCRDRNLDPPPPRC